MPKVPTGEISVLLQRSKGNLCASRGAGESCTSPKEYWISVLLERSNLSGSPEEQPACIKSGLCCRSIDAEASPQGKTRQE
eukprot:1156560-Pelagomonas_calceolata.AAC.8